MGRLTIADIESIKNTLEKLRTETMDTHGRISLIDDENIYEAINAVDKLAHYKDLEEQGRLIEQKHGTWEYTPNYAEYCSVCGFYPCRYENVSYNYCPNCGAKMELKELEGDKE